MCGPFLQAVSQVCLDRWRIEHIHNHGKHTKFVESLAARKLSDKSFEIGPAFFIIAVHVCGFELDVHLDGTIRCWVNWMGLEPKMKGRRFLDLYDWMV